MIPMLTGIFRFICNIVELIIYVYFMSSLFPIRKVKKETFLKVCCITVVFLYVSFELGELLDWTDLKFTIARVVVLTLFANLCLEGNKLYQCIWALISTLIVPIVNLLLIQLILLFSNLSFNDYLESDNVLFDMGMALSKILQFGVVRIILLIMKKKKVYFSMGMGLAFSVILGYSLLMEAILFYGMGIRAFEIYQRELLVLSIGIIGIDVCLISVMLHISEKRYQEEQLKLLQMQNQFQELQMQEIQHTEKQVARLEHDYRNHLSVMQELMETKKYDDLQQYLREVNQYYITEYKQHINTGNGVLDAILNTRISVCKEEGIVMICVVTGMYSDQQNFMLGTILFNLLDNAIEACRREQGDREIRLQLERNNESIDFIIKNRIEQSVLKDNSALKTIKADKTKHGLGLKHVDELVSQANGILSIFEEEKYFCVHGMIPKYVEK